MDPTEAALAKIGQAAVDYTNEVGECLFCMYGCPNIDVDGNVIPDEDVGTLEHELECPVGEFLKLIEED